MPASGPTVSAVAAVRNVANKIKSRLSQLNNDDKRGPLFPDLIDSCEDEAVGYAKSLSCQKEYLNPLYVTSSSSQVFLFYWLVSFLFFKILE